MESISKRIKSTLPNLTERIIDTDLFLEELQLPNSKKRAALRELSRLEASNELVRISKGVYAKNEVSQITKKNKPVSDREIVRYYTKDNEGLLVGYDLYNQRNISTQISKKKTVFSSRLKKESRNVKAITVKKVDMAITEKNKLYIEVLEIIENSNAIQDFNNRGFFKLMEEFVGRYDIQTMTYILNNLSYKKQTIFNLNKILEKFGKESGLERYLNATSRYKVNKAYEAVSTQR